MQTLERRPGNITEELGSGVKRVRHASPQPDDDEHMLEDIGMRNSTTKNQAESGSDSDDSDEPVEQTPDMVAGEALREACFAGNKSEVARLIDVVSSVDLRSGSGVSALMAAIAGGCEQLPSLFEFPSFACLEHNVSHLDRKDRGSFTLDLSGPTLPRDRHVDIASHLLDRGANLNARDDWNQSALHIAVTICACTAPWIMKTICLF